MRPLIPLLVLLAGCTEPEVPAGQVFTPPAEYRAIYAEAESCTGRRGDFDRLVFITVPEPWPCQEWGECAGHFEGRTIWIAESHRGIRKAILHELIHSLGIQGHPYHPFTEPCHAMWR